MTSALGIPIQPLDPETPITPNFKYKEAGQPARHGFNAEPYPVSWLDRLQTLFNTGEVIRAACVEALDGEDCPLTVLSCYRSPEYNEAVDGKPHSQHMAGRAMDIQTPKIPAAKLHAIIEQLIADGKAPDVGGLGLYNDFVHVDIREKIGGHIARWDESDGPRLAANA